MLMTHTDPFIHSSILNLAERLVVIVENLLVPMGSFYNGICGVEIWNQALAFGVFFSKLESTAIVVLEKWIERRKRG